MSAPGTTLATQVAMVDAYVDALLAMPLAPSPAAEATPAVPVVQADPAPKVAEMDTGAADAPDIRPGRDVAAAAAADVLPATDTETEVEVEVEADGFREPETETWTDDQATYDRVQPSAADAMPSGAPAPAPASQPVHEVAPAARASAPAAVLPPMAEPEEDRLIQAAPVGQRWLRVAVGEDRYAVELLRVQEVVRLTPVIAVRGAVPSLLGVMNLRGRVVPVHDLGRWLRRLPVQPDERARIVVLEYQDELVGLLVTAVTDVVTLDTPQIEPPTPGLRDRIGMGIARTPGAPPTVLLDARVVFD